jgi:hypothetical protein
MVLKTLSFFYKLFRLWIASFLEDEVLISFGIEGDFDVLVFKDWIGGGLLGQLVPDHHFIFDFFCQEIDFSLELEGVI